MHPTLNIAVKAARRAGQIINRASLDVDKLRIDVKQQSDYVTEVDRAAEAAILDVLREAYPTYGILAEESGLAGTSADNEFQWIIDPLDGTTNFIHGVPQYAISIGLAHKGVMTQAVVYDPNRNEIFTASKGGGAFVNEKRIRVAKRFRLDEALIATSRIVLLGLVMDTVYQVIEFDTFHPVEALIIALLLGVLPYLVLRGLVTRIARRWVGNKPASNTQ